MRRLPTDGYEVPVRLLTARKIFTMKECLSSAQEIGGFDVPVRWRIGAYYGRDRFAG